MKRKRNRHYKVRVSEARRFWGLVTVEAESEEEAEEIARDEFCPCWDDSVCLDSDASVVSEEKHSGVPSEMD